MTKSTLNSALSFLKQTRIFKDADEKILTSVLNTYGKSVSYAKNDIVFSRETYSPVLCLIIKGEARVSKGETVISHLKDGEIFGAAFLYNQSYEFENTVTALTPLKVVIIEKNGVDELIKCDSSVSFNYISYLSERIGFLNSKLRVIQNPVQKKNLCYTSRKTLI